MHVLLIEDNPGDAAMVSSMLAPGQFKVDVAETLQSGVAKAAAKAHSVILVDLDLPDSLGVDTYRDVRASVDTPVVVVSGHQDTALAALAEGAEDVLIKGQFDGKHLQQTIRSAIVRAEMQRSLVAQHRGFRAIIEHHPDGVLVVDEIGVVLFANPAAELLFGATAAELAGEEFGYPIAEETTRVTLLQDRGGESTKITAELRTESMDWDGRPATVVFVRDIGALVREEALLTRTITELTTRVSGRQFGALSLREADSAHFAELAAAYAELLETALEVRAYKSKKDYEGAINEFVDVFTMARPGPRDLIEIHTTVLRDKISAAPPPRAEAYLEEGRLLVLKLMGRLVTFYRPFAVGGLLSRAGGA